MFLGRHHEYEVLNGFFEGNQCSVGVVTGSVGMGKSTLLRRFAEDNGGIYIEAYETTAKQLHQEIGRIMGIEGGLSSEDFCQEIMSRASLKKQLVVIDQYNNIVKSDPEFNKILYHYVTGKFQKLPIKIIFCSDAFIQMDKYVTGKKALWKDEILINLEIKALGFYESLEFFSDASATEAVFLYGITGGIPYNLVRVAAMLGVKGFESYKLQRVTDANRIKEIAKRLYLDKDSSIGLKPEVAMAFELRELSYYNYMLSTLASGINRVNAISAEVEKPKDIVVPYLNSLMSIGLVTKDTAITELTNRKKTRYSIVNTSTLFWYKYIAANYDMYSKGDADSLWEKVEATFDDYMKDIFVRVCSEYLLKQSKVGMLPFSIDAIGNWWVNDDEAGTTDGFDLVSLGKCDGKSATIYCQCYYNSEPIEVAQLKQLIEKTKQLHRDGDAFYLVFSKAGFHENAITISSAIKNIMLITLDEMR